MAMDEDAPISTFIDAEAGLLVVVGRAEGRPTTLTGSHPMKPTDELIGSQDHSHSPESNQ